MTKKQQRSAIIGLLTGWLVLLVIGGIMKIKFFITMAPLLFFLAIAVWMWRTVDTFTEINKSNKKKK